MQGRQMGFVELPLVGQRYGLSDVERGEVVYDY
jgi:hypothetical protein